MTPADHTSGTLGSSWMSVMLLVAIGGQAVQIHSEHVPRRSDVSRRQRRRANLDGCDGGGRRS